MKYTFFFAVVSVLFCAQVDAADSLLAPAGTKEPSGSTRFCSSSEVAGYLGVRAMFPMLDKYVQYHPINFTSQKTQMKKMSNRLDLHDKKFKKFTSLISTITQCAREQEAIDKHTTERVDGLALTLLNALEMLQLMDKRTDRVETGLKSIIQLMVPYEQNTERPILTLNDILAENSGTISQDDFIRLFESLETSNRQILAKLKSAEREKEKMRDEIQSQGADLQRLQATVSRIYELITGSTSDSEESYESLSECAQPNSSLHVSPRSARSVLLSLDTTESSRRGWHSSRSLPTSPHRGRSPGRLLTPGRLPFSPIASTTPRIDEGDEEQNDTAFNTSSDSSSQDDEVLDKQADAGSRGSDSGSQDEGEARDNDEPTGALVYMSFDNLWEFDPSDTASSHPPIPKLNIPTKIKRKSFRRAKKDPAGDFSKKNPDQ